MILQTVRVVHIAKTSAPVALRALLCCQKISLDKLLQVNKVRVSCKCGKGLIRGISISGRSKWQNLPEFLSCFCKLIYKSVRFFRKASNSVVGRDAGYRQQNTAGSHHVFLLSVTVFTITIICLLYSFHASPVNINKPGLITHFPKNGCLICKKSQASGKFPNACCILRMRKTLYFPWIISWLYNRRRSIQVVCSTYRQYPD